MQEQHRLLHILYLVNRRAITVDLPVLAWMPQKDFTIEAQIPVTLRPGRHQIGVPILTHATGKKIIRIAGQGTGHHIAAVTGAINGNALSINPWDSMKIARRIETIL